MGLAFFDLDNTLIAGDSAQAFSEFIATSEVPTPADFLAVNQSFMDDYDAGRLNLHAYMRYTLAPLIGLRPKMVEELVQRFLDEVLNDRILPAARELLDHHRACGDELVIVSATGSHLVEPIAGRLAVPHVLAVDVERVEGLITGNMTGIPTFREGKVTRVQALVTASRSRFSQRTFLQRLTQRLAAAGGGASSGGGRSRSAPAPHRRGTRLANHLTALR
jgi:HAD superfamily hydrolase (TIGR01490 family)